MVINLLIFFSGLFVIVQVVPYLIDVLRKKTKPRIVSWFVWALMPGIAGVAALVDKQYPTAILLGATAFGSLLVVILGWKFGDKKFEKLDIVCLVGAVVGIILWQIFNSPAIGAIAMVLIDLIGGLPTTVHAWKKPHEETWLAFGLVFLGSVCTLIVISDWKITSFIFPLWLTLNSLNVTLIILIRRFVINKKKR